MPVGSLVKLLVRFATSTPLEDVHPLQSGVFRRRRRSERRPGLPAENALAFWARQVWQTLRVHVLTLGMIARLVAWAVVIQRTPNARRYMDRALTPVTENEDLELLTKTNGAKAAVDHLKKVHDLTHRKPAVAQQAQT